ncbi:MAG: TraB/GumN family protein [Sphingomonas sp.]|nr:TraB/GumN family protein [Sphingomonas sp.]
MRKFAIAGALAAAGMNAGISAPASAASIPSALPDADPAIWVINDEDTIIYLFGTFHALDGKSAWFNDEVRTAFAASDELVLETLVPDWRGEGAMPAARTEAQAGGAPSYLAATRMAISAGRARGLKAGNGADAVLRQAAEYWGKPVGGLESFSAQAGMLNHMPAAVRPASAMSPAQASRTMDELSFAMSELQTAWNRGDWRLFGAMLTDMRVTSPRSYNLMFAQRNATMANWIAERLQRPGTVFVAVGTGHLVGRDSVQAKLALRGFRSTRIN